MARKRLKMVKKALCLIFAFLLSINTFAAVVTDNNGAAFITKAEFDSLKNTFQSQLNSFNSNIDNKIDNAISSYLSGIKQQSVVYLDNTLEKVNQNSIDGYYDGGIWTKYGYRTMAKKLHEFSTQKANGAILNFLMMRTIVVNDTGSSWQKKGSAISRLGIDYQARGTFEDRLRPTAALYRPGIYLICSSTNSGSFVSGSKLSTIEYRYWAGLGSAGLMTDASLPATNELRGSFLWGEDGNVVLENDKNYWSVATKDFVLSWGSPSASAQPSTAQMQYGATYSPVETSFNMPIVGSISGQAWCLLNKDYPVMMLDDDYDEFDGYESRIVEIRERSNLDTIVQTNRMDTGWASYGHVKIKYNHHPVQEKNLDALVDSAIYESTNTEVKFFEGLPLFTATDTGYVRFNIEFYNQANDDVYIGLSTVKFNNDGSYVIDDELNLRDYDDILYTTHEFESNKTYSFKVDVKKNQTLWLKTYDPNNDYELTGAHIVGDIELNIEV